MNDLFLGFAVSLQINPSLPRLAWVVEVDRQDLRLDATIGNDVEYGPDFLVAGVWDGPFRDSAFDTTEAFFGTGVAVRDGAVTLVPSAAISDAIYYHVSQVGVTASNSLPLLLAAIGDQLDPGFALYDRVTESIHSGIDAYEKIVPTIHGQVARIFYRNLRITPSTIEEVDKPRPPHFSDFSSYLSYITEGYASIYKNIRDAGRHHRLDILSTQSSGYDTTAVNAIAAQHDIDNVFTISEPYELGAFVGAGRTSEESDDGTEICRALGIPVTPIERRQYQRSFDDEYLFYATTYRADSASFLGIKPHLQRTSVMLTGILGDNTWATDSFYKRYYRKNPYQVPEMLADDLRGMDIWAHGLSEVGIEWGFVLVSPIFIGARHRSEIFQLTMSEEMSPWRLGNDYDRPIARRIAEELGHVPRHLFGQHKLATLTSFALPPVPVNTELRREYFKFLREHRLASPFWTLAYRWVHRINARIHHGKFGYYRYPYYISRIISKLARRNISLPLLSQNLNGRLYCFCVNKRVSEYEAALKGESRMANAALPLDARCAADTSQHLARGSAGQFGGGAR
jgi:hypothetical protein